LVSENINKPSSGNNWAMPKIPALFKNIY